MNNSKIESKFIVEDIDLWLEYIEYRSQDKHLYSKKNGQK